MEIAKKDQPKPPIDDKSAAKAAAENRGRAGSTSEYGHGKKKAPMQKTFLEDAYSFFHSAIPCEKIIGGHFTIRLKSRPQRRNSLISQA